MGTRYSFREHLDLQWGRDSSVAEIGRHTPGLEEVQDLQWGRDSSVAEIAVGRPGRCAGKPFNGAATLQSRKSRCR